jgi:hypothetical protein
MTETVIHSWWPPSLLALTAFGLCLLVAIHFRGHGACLLLIHTRGCGVHSDMPCSSFLFHQTVLALDPRTPCTSWSVANLCHTMYTMVSGQPMSHHVHHGQWPTYVTPCTSWSVANRCHTMYTMVISQPVSHHVHHGQWPAGVTLCTSLSVANRCQDYKVLLSFVSSFRLRAAQRWVGQGLLRTSSHQWMRTWLLTLPCMQRQIDRWEVAWGSVSCWHAAKQRGMLIIYF